MEQLQSILTDLDNKAITKHQAYDLILVLFDVVGRSEQLNCDHEWKVEAFDCYGMPYERYCVHCGKKEAI